MVAASGRVAPQRLTTTSTALLRTHLSRRQLTGLAVQQVAYRQGAMGGSVDRAGDLPSQFGRLCTLRSVRSGTVASQAVCTEQRSRLLPTRVMVCAVLGELDKPNP